MAQPFRSHAATAEASGSYQPLFELGRGGMGTVFVARAIGAGGFERLVVIKRLHAHLTEQKDAVRRFLDEARMAAFVRHANVVGTLQVGSDDDGFFLVLDYVEGASLENLLDYSALRQVALDPPVVLRIALDACAGLQAVHDAEDSAGRPLKILHRDVSLQNVLVGRDGVARIADFGVAKSAFASVSTDKSYVVGKLLYLPPEYLLRDPTGPSLDVYSLGMTLWLTLSGQEPWPGASEAQLVRHILESDVPPLSSVMQVAPQIEQLIAKACRRKQEERYQSAREMAADIEAIARETNWVASHAEVAACIEKLAGPDLKRRRELVADALARADQPQQRRRLMQSHAPPPPDAPSDPKPAHIAAASDDERPAVSAAVVAVSGARPPGRSALLVLGVFTVLAAFGGWLWQRSQMRSPGAADTVPSSAPVAPAQAAATPAAHTVATAAPPEVPRGAVSALVPETSSAAAPGPRRLPAPPPRRAPVAHTAAPSVPAPSPPAPGAAPAEPAQVGDPIQAPRAPDGISRKNPYRTE